MNGASLVILNKVGVAPEAELAAVLHPDYKLRFSQWTRVRDCVEGQDQIKGRRDVYLPRKDKQSDDSYQAHLDRAVFFNATGRTRAALLSSIFRRPGVELLPRGWSTESVTRDGKSLKKVVRWLAEEVVTVSRAGALVDLPEEESTGVNPFLSLYPAEHILSWLRKDGVLKMVLLAERVVDPNKSFNMFTLSGKWRLRLLALDENGEYFQFAGAPETFGGMTSYPEDGRIYPEIRGRRLRSIPFYFFGLTANSEEPEKPLLLDIADLNIAHYRQYATLETARAYIGSPIYTTFTSSETDDEEALVVSPELIWEFAQNDKAEILEFRGQGIGSLERGLEEKEEQMRVLGARLVSQRKGAAARSSVADDASLNHDDATLLDVVNSVSEGMTAILKLIAEWIGLPSKDIRYTLNKHFNAPNIGARELRAIDACLDRSMRPKDIFKLLQEGGLIADDEDEAEYVEWIEKIKRESEEAAALKAAPRTTSSPADRAPVARDNGTVR